MQPGRGTSKGNAREPHHDKPTTHAHRISIRHHPPRGWTACAELADMHSVTGRAFPCSTWWIIETKE